MEPADIASALAGEPRKPGAAAASAPGAALWLTNPTTEQTRPNHNALIIEKLLNEISRGELCTPAELETYEAKRQVEEETECNR